jgi:hypothetical protein
LLTSPRSREAITGVSDNLESVKKTQTLLLFQESINYSAAVFPDERNSWHQLRKLDRAMPGCLICSGTRHQARIAILYPATSSDCGPSESRMASYFWYRSRSGRLNQNGTVDYVSEKIFPQTTSKRETSLWLSLRRRNCPDAFSMEFLPQGLRFFAGMAANRLIGQSPPPRLQRPVQRNVCRDNDGPYREK